MRPWWEEEQQELIWAPPPLLPLQAAQKQLSLPNKAWHFRVCWWGKHSILSYKKQQVAVSFMAGLSIACCGDSRGKTSSRRSAGKRSLESSALACTSFPPQSLAISASSNLKPGTLHAEIMKSHSGPLGGHHLPGEFGPPIMFRFHIEFIPMCPRSNPTGPNRNSLFNRLTNASRGDVSFLKKNSYAGPLANSERIKTCGIWKQLRRLIVLCCVFPWPFV